MSQTSKFAPGNAELIAQLQQNLALAVGIGESLLDKLEIVASEVAKLEGQMREKEDELSMARKAKRDADRKLSSLQEEITQVQGQSEDSLEQLAKLRERIKKQRFV